MRYIVVGTKEKKVTILGMFLHVLYPAMVLFKEHKQAAFYDTLEIHLWQDGYDLSIVSWINKKEVVNGT